MLLAVDIGNSQTSFGVFDKSLLHHWRCETKSSRTADEVAAFLFPLLQYERIAKEAITGVALCSVVPTLDEIMRGFSKGYLDLEPYTVVAGDHLPFRLNVEVPAEVGADRIANAAYAVSRLRLPAVVVDIGTAVTFDVVGRSGQYEGGAILPGLRLGVESLGAKTAKLPLVGLEFPRGVIGRNTTDCIRSGLLFGYCDVIDGILDRIAAELAAEPETVLTGGNSDLFKGRLRHRCETLPDLTMEGVRILYEAPRHA